MGMESRKGNILMKQNFERGNKIEHRFELEQTRTEISIKY